MALFAGPAGLAFTRRLVSRSGKLRVAAAAAPAPRNNKALIGGFKVVQLLTGLLVIQDGADRNVQHHIGAVATCLVGALAVAPALRLVFRIEAEVHQGVVA